MSYNNKVVGVWCNGSTAASDSAGVSSILTTPATSFVFTHETFFILSEQIYK